MASHFQISKYITKLQQFKEYCTGTRTDIGTTGRVESPQTNPHIPGQPIFDKGAKNRQQEKDVFNQ